MDTGNGTEVDMSEKGLVDGPDGKPRLARLVGRVCLRPWEVPQLLQLRRDTNAALASLGRLIGGFGAAGLP